MIWRSSRRAICEDTHLLVLTARKKRIQQQVKEMRIWVDTVRTRITFHDLRPNAPLRPATFFVNLPRDVFVSNDFRGLAFCGRGF